MNWSRNTINTGKKESVLLFMLWPFFALVYAIRNYKAVWAKDIIWLFVIFYGFTLTIHNVGEETNDANRYRDKFIAMANSEVSFETITGNFYNAEEQSLDILETVIIFFISRFTDNYHILFAIFGLIYGYFYSRNTWYLIDRAGSRIVPANIPIILTFAFVVGFWQLSGFRFWTATHLFVFGTLPFLFEGKKKYLWVAILSAFMHFSYLLPLGILAIYVLLGNRNKLFFGLFITTFFIKELDLGQIRDFLLNNVPQIFIPKVKTYTNVDYAGNLAESISKVNWYVKVYDNALKWAISAFIVVIFVTGKKFLTKNKGFNSLLSFTLLLYSVANVFSLLPSGGRFLYLSNLFAVAFIFFYVQYAPRGKAIKRVITIAIPALALYNIVAIRLAFDTMSFFSVFGNPPLSVFIDADITLIEIVKGLL